MPDPRADPRLTLRVWGYGVDDYIPFTCLALLKQRVGHAAGEVLRFVVHANSFIFARASSKVKIALPDLVHVYA
jgi:hypothetical protein